MCNQKPAPLQSDRNHMVQRDDLGGDEVTRRQAGLKPVSFLHIKIPPYLKYRILCSYKVLFDFMLTSSTCNA